MFRGLICPSSGVWDYVVELPHWLFSNDGEVSICANFSIIAEQYSQCGSSTTWTQTPEDGYIKARNMLSV